MKKRSEIAKEFQWDLESVYATPEEFEKEFKQLKGMIDPVLAFKGKLDSAETLAKLFEADDELSKVLERIYLYAHMEEDSDTTVSKSQERMSRVRSLYAQIAGQTAWINPEILSQSEETLKSWAESDALKPYRRTMEVLLRQKPHTLSVEEETLLGHASEIFGSTQEAFGKLTNADMKFDPVVDKEGVSHEVTNGSFYTLLLNPDRDVREAAWRSIYKGFGDHKNTISSLLAGNSKTHVFNASIRKYEGALEASLFNDNIPVSVYESLIEAVHGALPIFHDYLKLRARALELIGDLNMWDLYRPIVPNVDMNVSWEECRGWIEESTKPLGEAYGEGVRSSFEDRWYDVYENEGKRSGAYSTHAFGKKPFMLLNYHGTLNDVFTVAHELGHSMHSHLSQLNQPYRYANYPIFLAEIASTTNEALLHDHLMKTQDDPRLRAYLLNHLCDSFRGTVYRQTMFAEFEWEMHKKLERGEALTSEVLSDYYYELNARYHGDAIKADPEIALEWSRIPHFYYNFYVYKYATGFAAAQIFAQQVLSGEEGRDKYLGFLKSGCSEDPLETVRKAGVDLSDPAVLQKGFATFRSAVDELTQLLDELATANT